MTSEKSILIVEDDEDTRFMYSAVLGAEGYQVFEAESVERALAVLEGEALVNMILLDLTMPGMTASEFVERKNQLDKAADIPIMTISGRADIVAASKKLGAIDSLMKPFDLEHLIEKIKNSFSLLGSHLTH